MKIKNILKSLVILLFVMTASAQQGINYKAMIKEANGDAIANTAVTVQFTILENGTTDVFKESHNPTTDASGIIIVNIGEGTLISGDFDTIDWGSNAHFLNTKIDSSDGLTDMGTTEFKTVPYALYASKVAGCSIPVYTSVEISELTPAIGDAAFNSTEKLYQIYDGTSWQMFAPSNCWPQPTVAVAGQNQSFTDGTTTINLTGNTPEEGHGTGEWTIIQGEGGLFSNTNDPNASFKGVLHEIYTLRWTISTGCGSTSDEVNISFTGIEVGAFYNGGIVFYVFQPTDVGYVKDETHGLICTTSDDVSFSDSNQVMWGCMGVPINGADGEGVGSGEQNTIDITSNCYDRGAARVCITLNWNGYTDWFLPSTDELYQIFLNQEIINSVSLAYNGTALALDEPYWSSTKAGDDQDIYAWAMTMRSGSKTIIDRRAKYRYRAIRSF